MPGKLICLDGFEGAGKTTQAVALQIALETSHGRDCRIVREPGGDKFAEMLREVLKHGKCEITTLAEVLAFNAARANMLALQVAPLLAGDIDVISDRSFISTLTYQGYGNSLEGAEMETLRQICKMGIQPAPPDAIIILDVSYEVAMMRKGVRGGDTDRFEKRPQEYLKRVNYGYLAEADRGNYSVVNANKSEAVVGAEVLKHVLPILD